MYQWSCNQLKSRTSSSKETSLESIAPNFLDMVLRQNWVGKSSFLLSALKL